MADFNQMIIDEFRANNGHVTTAGFGDGLVLLHTVGAKSGEGRINPLMALPVEGGWMVAASAAGAPRHPAWFHNIVANGRVRVETGEGIVDVAATVLEGADYDAGWAAFTTASPAFDGYRAKAGGRLIPVVKLTRQP